MAQIHTYKIERLKVVEGLPHNRQTFFVRPGSRSRPWKFFQNGQVPEFEGDEAWFEIERRGPLWIFLRQIPKPSWVR